MGKQYGLGLIKDHQYKMIWGQNFKILTISFKKTTETYLTSPKTYAILSTCSFFVHLPYITKGSGYEQSDTIRLRQLVDL